jgi:hypothetical protein
VQWHLRLLVSPPWFKSRKVLYIFALPPEPQTFYSYRNVVDVEYTDYNNIHYKVYFVGYKRNNDLRGYKWLSG